MASVVFQMLSQQERELTSDNSSKETLIEGFITDVWVG